MKPKISIVLLNNNGSGYLKQSLPSILTQDYQNLEVVIIDNGSDLSELEFLKEFPVIKLIRNTSDLGYSAGKNQGIKNASGDYVLLLDNDIYINNKSLISDLVNIKEKDSLVITFPLLDIDKEVTSYYGCFLKQYGITSNKPFPIDKILSWPNLYECSYPHGGAIFINRDFFIKDFNYYDESQTFHLDDIDLGMYAWQKGLKCVVYNKDYLKHLGIKHTSNSKLQHKRFGLWFSGVTIAMLKNMPITTLLKHYPLFVAYFLYKSIFKLIINRDLGFIIKFTMSIIFSIKNISKTIEKRADVQKRLTNHNDIYFKLNHP